MCCLDPAVPAPTAMQLLPAETCRKTSVLLWCINLNTTLSPNGFYGEEGSKNLKNSDSFWRWCMTMNMTVILDIRIVNKCYERNHILSLSISWLSIRFFMVYFIILLPIFILIYRCKFIKRTRALIRTKISTTEIYCRTSEIHLPMNILLSKTSLSA